MRLTLALLLCLPLSLSSATLGPVVVTAPRYALRLSWTGEASYYARRFHGRLQANGQRHDARRLTAASNVIPMGRRVRVCREDRPSRCVEVEVTDTGELYGRLVDLSKAAARRLGMLRIGVVGVTVRSK